MQPPSVTHATITITARITPSTLHDSAVRERVQQAVGLAAGGLLGSVISQWDNNYTV